MFNPISHDRNVLDVVSCPTVYLGCAMDVLFTTVSFKQNMATPTYS